jgi:hypothetical protein
MQALLYLLVIKFALMIDYTSSAQLTIMEFETPFRSSLDPENKWVKLSESVPWDKFASIYMKAMDLGFGRPGVSPRTVLGALIIKHLMNLDDRGTIEAIQENPYMQFFVGLSDFTTKPIFDASLFVDIRKRVGNETFDKLNTQLIEMAAGKSDAKHNSSPKKKNEDGLPKNKGKLQMDATVADQYIKYPTDTDLMNSGRKTLEKIIDTLYELNDKQGVKPRTYRRIMDKHSLTFSKKRKKKKNEIRKMKHKLLEHLKRDISHINKMLDTYEKKGKAFPLKKQQHRQLWIITTLYEQQREMYNNLTNTAKNRIVSIHQPHVRPIKRGKQNSQTEFGSKLGVSLDNGFARIDTLSWDAYNESDDLINSVKSYFQLHGHYPELVQVDKIYHTKKNRKWLMDRNIRITATPLGRKPKKELTSYQKRKKKQETTERNHIEGKFGQGKNGYNLNKIRARLSDTSESWVSCIFFIMNLLNYEKGYFWAVFKRLLSLYFYDDLILLSKYHVKTHCIINNNNKVGEFSC